MALAFRRRSFVFESRRENRRRDAGATKVCSRQQTMSPLAHPVRNYEPAVWLIADMRFFISSGETSST